MKNLRRVRIILSPLSRQTLKNMHFSLCRMTRSWRAEVNGEEREVLNINGLMAVRIDGGENRILFEYEYLPIRQEPYEDCGSTCIRALSYPCGQIGQK